MLRIYFMQQWYGLSDPAMEDSLYDVQSMRHFTGVDFGKRARLDDDLQVPPQSGSKWTDPDVIRADQALPVRQGHDGE